MQNLIQFPKLGLEFSVYDGFQIGGFKIYFYGVVIMLGLLFGLIYAFKNFRKVGVDPDKAIDCILGGIVGGIVGARLYFVIFSWDAYGFDFSSWDGFWSSLWSIIATRDGGMAIYGGLIGALLVGVLIARWRKVNVKALLDIIGVGFLIGQGVGRWGNFINVEAFGSNTTLPWGMTGPRVVDYLTSQQASLEKIGVVVDPNMPVHPTFLYESLWCLLGFVLLALYMKHRKFDGEVFLMYLGYYGVGRFVIEGLRTDSLMIGSLRVSQALALALVFASILTIIIVRSRIKGNHDENYLKLFVETEEGIKISLNIKEEVPVEAVSSVEETTLADEEEEETEPVSSVEEDMSAELQEDETASVEDSTQEEEKKND